MRRRLLDSLLELQRNIPHRCRRFDSNQVLIALASMYSQIQNDRSKVEKRKNDTRFLWSISARCWAPALVISFDERLSVLSV